MKQKQGRIVVALGVAAVLGLFILPWAGTYSLPWARGAPQVAPVEEAVTQEIEKVVEKILTKEVVATPTPTLAPTATSTPTAQPTVVPPTVAPVVVDVRIAVKQEGEATLRVTGGAELTLGGKAQIEMTTPTPTPTVTPTPTPTATPEPTPTPSPTLAPVAACNPVALRGADQVPKADVWWKIAHPEAWRIVNFWSHQAGPDFVKEHKVLLPPGKVYELLGGGSWWWWDGSCEAVARDNLNTNPLEATTLEHLRDVLHVLRTLP